MITVLDKQHGGFRVGTRLPPTERDDRWVVLDGGNFCV